MHPRPRFTILDGRKVWQFENGRTVPYVSGGAGDEPAPEPTPEPAAEPAPEPAAEPAAEPAPEPGDEPLGTAGTKALEAMKERARKAEAELKTLREANMSEQERAIAQAREEGEAAGRAVSQAALFRAELRAAASGKLLDKAVNDLSADADVAMRQLGFDEVPVTATGDIDSEAISQAVTAYVADRPYLANGATPPPGIDQGPRTPPSAPSAAEAIAQAEANGDWKRARQLKSQLTFAATG